MTIRPEFLVRGLDGRPQPPQDVIAQLQAWDARIGLFYTNASWAITEAWRENDPRRQWVQSGEMQAEMAFDICGYLPVTCGLDEAMAYIQRELRSYTLEQFTALRSAVDQHNTKRQDAVMEAQILGAVSDDLDKSNIVTPGISAAVALDITPAPAPLTGIAKARAAKAAKRQKAG